jgi:hypothetical protein
MRNLFKLASTLLLSATLAACASDEETRTIHRDLGDPDKGGFGCAAVYIDCPDGTVAVNVDNTCDQECLACDTFTVVCAGGGDPIDSNNDGCKQECPGDVVACDASAVVCPDNAAPVDVNNDGCKQECPGDPVPPLPPLCPAYVPDCSNGEVPMDLDGDGCALECGQSKDTP